MPHIGHCYDVCPVLSTSDKTKELTHNMDQLVALLRNKQEAKLLYLTEFTIIDD